MNRKLRSLLLLFIFPLVLSGCSAVLPVTATSNDLGSKTGTAEGTCYFTVLCIDVDASIQTAAKNGGITKISTVDLKTTNVLGIIITYKTIVTGE